MKKSLFDKIKSILSNDITSFGSLVFFLFLVALFFALGDFFFALSLFIGLIIVVGIVVLIRSLYFKNRPLRQTHNSFLEKIDASSFPSLHSARVSLLFFLLLFSNYGILIIVLFGMLALVVMASRIILKKHDYIDVFAGLILGFLIALLVSFIL